MNRRIISHTLGWVLIIESLLMLLPLICAICYKEPFMLGSFIVASLAAGLVGFLLTLIKPDNKNMFAREGYITVALSWILMSLFGTIPFVVSGYIPNFIDAFFETVSGFTTTGASILTDVEILPKSLLFWRSFTHWIGGMGVLVFLVAILPLFGGTNLNLVKAESTGPAVSKLVPKVKSTAKILYSIYIALTVLMVILLLCGGLDLFESLTIAFGTAGTGGFGIVNSSISEFSPYVQIVVTIFMVLFGIDFSIYYLILMRKFTAVLKSEEVRTYLLIIFASIAVITLNVSNMFSSVSEALRHTSFQVASIISSTGYMTSDFNLWPSLSKTILVMLMFVGACAGSTGGGMKVSRIMILAKSIIKEIKILAHPKSTVKITMNGRLVEHETVRAVNVYTAAFFSIFVTTLLIISLDGFDFATNFTAVTTTLNNIGPGLNNVGPTENFSEFSNLSKITFSVAMLIGRLEIFPMLVLLSPTSWKK